MSILLHPRLLRAAEMDPLLDSMINRGCPLNRETWMNLMWGADIPKPWTVEHEMDVPEFWQNLDLVEDDEGRNCSLSRHWATARGAGIFLGDTIAPDALKHSVV